MSSQPTTVETVSTAADKAKLAAAGVLLIGSIVAFYALSNQDLWLRIVALLALIAAAVATFFFTEPGRQLVAFGRDSVREVRKVVWPTRKEAMQMTGYVMVDAERFRTAGMLPQKAADLLVHGIYRGAEFWMHSQEYEYYRRHLLVHEGTHCFMSFLSGPRLPFVVSWFDDAGLVILRALPPYGDLAGGSIAEANGHSASDMMSAFRQYYGGVDARRHILAPSFFTMTDVLVAAGFAPSSDSVHLKVLLPNGSVVERDVAAVSKSVLGPPPWWPSRWWSRPRRFRCRRTRGSKGG